MDICLLIIDFFLKNSIDALIHKKRRICMRHNWLMNTSAELLPADEQLSTIIKLNYVTAEC